MHTIFSMTKFLSRNVDLKMFTLKITYILCFKWKLNELLLRRTGTLKYPSFEFFDIHWFPGLLVRILCDVSQVVEYHGTNNSSILLCPTGIRLQPPQAWFHFGVLGDKPLPFDGSAMAPGYVPRWKKYILSGHKQVRYYQRFNDLKFF